MAIGGLAVAGKAKENGWNARIAVHLVRGWEGWRPAQGLFRDVPTAEKLAHSLA